MSTRTHARASGLLLAMAFALLAGQPDPVSAAGQAPAASPTPYPEAWIEAGRKTNAPRTREPGCLHLVYKRGCAEKRTGRVTVGITLDPGTGKVTTANVVRSTIHTDPKPMLKCITEGLSRWTFKAPGGHAPAFELTLIYSDRC